MNRNKFLQIQNSLVAKGEDLDVLNYIVDDLIYTDMYNKLFKHPNITNDETSCFKLEGNIVVTRGLTIPRNVSELKSNKRSIIDILCLKLAKDGWKNVYNFVDVSDNIRYQYHSENGKITHIHYNFGISPMSYFDKLMFKLFKTY